MLTEDKAVAKQEMSETAITAAQEVKKETKA